MTASAATAARTHLRRPAFEGVEQPPRAHFALHVHVLPVPHHVRLGGCQVELRLRRRRRRSDTRPHTQAITSHSLSRNGAQLTHLVGQIHHEGRDGVVHAVQNRLRKRIARVADASHRHPSDSATRLCVVHSGPCFASLLSTLHTLQYAVQRRVPTGVTIYFFFPFFAGISYEPGTPRADTHLCFAKLLRLHQADELDLGVHHGGTKLA